MNLAALSRTRSAVRKIILDNVARESAPRSALFINARHNDAKNTFKYTFIYTQTNNVV